MLRETTEISFVEGVALAANTMQRPEILGHGLLARVEDMGLLEKVDYRGNAPAHLNQTS